MGWLEEEKKKHGISVTTTNKNSGWLENERNKYISGVKNEMPLISLRPKKPFSFQEPIKKIIPPIPTTSTVINRPKPTEYTSKTAEYLDKGYKSVAKNVLDPIESFSTGLNNSATLGLHDYLIPLSDRQKKMQEENPYLKGAGDLAGYIMPGVGIEKALLKIAPKLALKEATKVGGKVVAEKLLPRIGKGMVTSGLTGGVMGGVEGGFKEAGRKLSPNEQRDVTGKALEGAENFAMGGAAFGGVLPILGKAFKSIKGKISNAKTNNQLKAIDNSYSNMQNEGLSNFTPINKPSPISRPNLPLATSRTANINEPSNILSPSENLNVLEGQKIAPKQQPPINNNIPLTESPITELGNRTTRSRVYTNTIENGSIFDKVEKDIINSGFTDDALQTSKSEIQSMKNAKTRLDNDYQGEINKALNPELRAGQRNLGEDTDVIMGLLENEKIKAKETGDYTLVRELANKGAREHGKNVGQGVQAFDKYTRTAEGKIYQASKVAEETTDDILKNNPKVKENYNNDLKEINQGKKDILKETDKTIDKLSNDINKLHTTDFVRILQNKISNKLQPKSVEEVGTIRNMLSDIFEESKQKIPYPKNGVKPNESISTLANSYKLRNYKNEIRANAITALKEEFKDNAEFLKHIDDYAKSGFKPPHSEKLINSVINKRIGGMNQPTTISSLGEKANLKDWIKDWYATGRTNKEDFIQSLMNETGLSGDGANSLRNLLESRLHVATKIQKDKLLELAMKEKGIKGVVKNATTKLKELTNIGLLENKKFTARISEKTNPIIKQLMRENNIDMNDIVRLSARDKNTALATLKRDVFRNTNVDDTELVKLIDIVNSEFKSLTKSKQEQIFNNLLKEKPINVKKTLSDKIQEKINLGLYDDELDALLQSRIKEKYKLPELSNEEVKYISETMDDIQGLDPRSEKYLESIAKVEKMILEKTPASLQQKIASTSFVTMLGNITSPVTNFIGNTAIAIPELTGNTLAKRFDKFVKRVAKTDFNTAGDLNKKTLVKGAFQGARSVKRDALGGRDFKEVAEMIKGKTIKEKIKIISDITSNPIDTDISTLGVADKLEITNRLASESKLGRTAENAVRTIMKIGDIPFNRAYYEAELEQLLTNNPNGKLKDIMDTALQISQERTFKDKNLLSNTALKMKNLFKGADDETLRGWQQVKQVPQIGLNSVIPFAKTPANMAKRGMEYSPLGLIEGAGKLALNKNKMTMMKQREIVDRFTRGTIGTGLLGAGTLAYKSGLITDERDLNANTEEFKKQSGYTPDALKVGNKTIDVKKVQPFFTPVIAGARISQGDISGGVNTAISGVSGALEQYTELPLLQGLADVATAFSGTSRPYQKEKALINILTAIPKQLTPSIAKKLAYAIDPFERDLGKGMVDNIVGKLPFVSKKFPAKIDVYGNPIKSYGGNNTLANTMANPFVTKEITKNPVSKEALRLNKLDTEYKDKVIPSEVSDKIKDIKLTPEEKTQYQKYMGDNLQTEINKLLNNPDYLQLSDTDKAMVFSGRIDNAIDIAKEKMYKNLGIDEKKINREKAVETRTNKIINRKLGVK